jgi:hypothetical protein
MSMLAKESGVSSECVLQSNTKRIMLSKESEFSKARERSTLANNQRIRPVPTFDGSGGSRSREIDGEERVELVQWC